MAGKQFQDYLEQTAGTAEDRYGRLTVHSVFRRVLNLHVDEGMLSVAMPGLGMSATCLVVDFPPNLDFEQLGIKRGMTVKPSGRWLLIEDALAIDCRSPALWIGREPSELAWRSGDLLWTNLKALLDGIICWGRKEGLAALLYQPDHPLAARLDLLSRGLLQQKEKLLASAVRNFIGLGPGLTPSGDDLLLGLLAAVQTGLEYRAVAVRLQQAISSDLKRTSDLGAHFLREGIKGNFHEYLQEAIYVLIHGIPPDVTRAARTLMKVGACSGTDMAAGLYLGFYWQCQVQQMIAPS
jgi:hypothetical protein